ncbi:MAG TPA: hypothetical protein VF725_09000, partial [Ktedonobacterales bacterium]
MRYLRTHLTLRYGLIAAIVNATLLGVDQAAHALGPTIIQTPQGRRALTVAFFSFVALVTLVVGYLTARGTGRVRAALSAGAMAVGLPLGVVSSIRTVATQSNQLETDIFAIVLLAGAGTLAGAIVALLGGLVGWARYRQAHREEVAAPAAQRATARAAARQRRKRERLGLFGWLMVAAIVAVTMAPMGLTYLAQSYLDKWQGLAASGAALLVGYGLLKLADRARWQGYLYDFVGLTLIASGLIVGIGEITGYAISLIAGIGPMAYIWRAMNRSLGVRKPAA